MICMGMLERVAYISDAKVYSGGGAHPRYVQSVTDIYPMS